MILKPGVVPWFFTAKLGGCNVFLATAENKRNNPMAIHSNLNSCGNKLDNVWLKGETVVQKLRVAHLDYTLIARVYSAPPAEDKDAN